MVDINESLKGMIHLAKEYGPGAFDIAYYHDDWCPCSSGTRGLVACTCEPDMQVRVMAWEERSHPGKKEE